MKSVIELAKTANGYAVVEKGVQINKVHSKPTKEKTTNASKKFVQQNFTIYPYLYTQDVESNQKYIIMPAKSQWFTFANVHEIEKKALPEWFKMRKVIFGSLKPDKFEKNEQLYKKYRNYIIDLGKTQYVSPTRARKGLAGDVCAIMRIHNFLEKWGLINYVFSKTPQQNIHPMQAQTIMEAHLRKDCIDKDKKIYEKHFDKDYFQLLKKITRKYRPFCHLCDGICGTIWYEYSEQFVLKQFTEVPKENEEGTKKEIISDGQPFTYLLRLCASCLTSGSIPIVLSLNNFTKKTLLDQLEYRYEEPKDKRRVNEQNKLLQTIQKNRFNIKKSAETLKMSERDLYEALMFIPMIKIEKLSRIDAETDAQEMRNGVHPPRQSTLENRIQKDQMNEEQKEMIVEEKDMLQLFLAEKDRLQDQEIVLYQELIQKWLLKISAKVGKLSEWEKSTKWYGNRVVSEQKNSLADLLKQA